MQKTTLRNAYLEYLRNLTPQILLLSIAMIIGIRLDLHKFDLSNTKETVAFFGFIGAFVFAMFANLTNFMEHATRTSPETETAAKALAETKPNILKHILMIFWIFFTRDRLLLARVVFAIVVVGVTYATVFTMSVQTATNLYNLMHAH